MCLLFLESRFWVMRVLYCLWAWSNCSNFPINQPLIIGFWFTPPTTPYLINHPAPFPVRNCTSTWLLLLHSSVSPTVTKASWPDPWETHSNRNLWTSELPGSSGSVLNYWDFLGGPVAQTPHSNSRGPGSVMIRELDPTCHTESLNVATKKDVVWSDEDGRPPCRNCKTQCSQVNFFFNSQFSLNNFCETSSLPMYIFTLSYFVPNKHISSFHKVIQWFLQSYLNVSQRFPKSVQITVPAVWATIETSYTVTNWLLSRHNWLTYFKRTKHLLWEQGDFDNPAFCDQMKREFTNLRACIKGAGPPNRSCLKRYQLL